MLTKCVAALAVIGSAVAYVPPMMSLSANRREAIAGAAAGAAMVPLGANAIVRADPKDLVNMKVKTAPVIEIFDARDCVDRKSSSGVQYKGEYTGGPDDQMCVKIQYSNIVVSEATAAKKRQEFIGLRQTAINVDQIARTDKPYGAGRPDYSGQGL